MQDEELASIWEAQMGIADEETDPLRSPYFLRDFETAGVYGNVRVLEDGAIVLLDPEEFDTSVTMNLRYQKVMLTTERASLQGAVESYLRDQGVPVSVLDKRKCQL